MSTEGLIKIGVAGVAGYYVMGKKPIGAIVGIAVLYVLMNTILKPTTNAGVSEMIVIDDTQNGPPVATGLPAPGTTADPSGGIVDPNNSTKRIGVLR